VAYLPVSDARAWAGAVTDLLSDPAAAGRARVEGPERAGLFTWERTARMTVDAYTDALGRG
jgi:glycosyltransferase involved in cell wall biosynthesis